MLMNWDENESKLREPINYDIKLRFQYWDHSIALFDKSPLVVIFNMMLFSPLEKKQQLWMENPLVVHQKS